MATLHIVVLGGRQAAGLSDGDRPPLEKRTEKCAPVGFEPQTF
jgi:hypothetical protein